MTTGSTITLCAIHENENVIQTLLTFCFLFSSCYVQKSIRHNVCVCSTHTCTSQTVKCGDGMKEFMAHLTSFLHNFFFCATQPPTLLAIFLFFFILFIYRDEERRWRRATHRGEEEEEESWLHFSWQTASHPLNGRMHTAKLLHILYTTYTYSEKVGGWWGVIPAKNPRDSSYPQLISRRRTPLIISKLPNANFSLSAFAVGDAWSMEQPDLNDQYIKPIQQKALTDFSNIVQVFLTNF